MAIINVKQYRGKIGIEIRLLKKSFRNSSAATYLLGI